MVGQVARAFFWFEFPCSRSVQVSNFDSCSCPSSGTCALAFKTYGRFSLCSRFSRSLNVALLEHKSRRWHLRFRYRIDQFNVIPSARSDVFSLRRCLWESREEPLFRDLWCSVVYRACFTSLPYWSCPKSITFCSLRGHSLWRRRTRFRTRYIN